MTIDNDSLLDECVRLPQHVVHRTFVAETVVLNLNTGQYHGLNPMGGRMLDALNTSASVRAAAETIAAEYGQDPVTVESDLAAFCADLLRRGLIEVAQDADPDENS